MLCLAENRKKDSQAMSAAWKIGASFFHGKAFYPARHSVSLPVYPIHSAQYSPGRQAQFPAADGVLIDNP